MSKPNKKEGKMENREHMNAVAKTEGQLPTTQRPPIGPSIALQGDLIIPRILLMQGLSDMVKERKAHMGDIVRSTNGERLGGIKKPGEPSEVVEIIPLTMQNSWTVMNTDGNKFVRSEPRTAQNDMLPWEFQEDGEDLKRLKTVDLIAILPQDIRNATTDAKVDADGIPLDLENSVLLPVAISFRSTGFKAGKGVATFFAKVEALQKTSPKVRPYHFTLPLSCFDDSNEDGNFYVFDIGPSKRTDAALLDKAAEWYDVVKQTPVVVQDEKTAEQKAAEAAPQSSVPPQMKKKAQF